MELTNYGPIAQATANNFETKNNVGDTVVIIALLVGFAVGIAICMHYRYNLSAENNRSF